MNCYQAKTGELSRQWYVIDASEQVVGRLAAQIAPILMGKHRPTYTPHIDTGDYVIVTNVDKVVFTGNKWQQKSYQRYSGYPAGQRDEAAWKLFQRRPERILELAIQRMLPKSKLGRQMIDKLKLHVVRITPTKPSSRFRSSLFPAAPHPPAPSSPLPRCREEPGRKPESQPTRCRSQPTRCRSQPTRCSWRPLPMRFSPTIKNTPKLMNPPRIKARPSS